MNKDGQFFSRSESSFLISFNAFFDSANDLLRDSGIRYIEEIKDIIAMIDATKKGVEKSSARKCQILNLKCQSRRVKNNPRTGPVTTPNPVTLLRNAIPFPRIASEVVSVT